MTLKRSLLWLGAIATAAVLLCATPPPAIAFDGCGASKATAMLSTDQANSGLPAQDQVSMKVTFSAADFMASTNEQALAIDPGGKAHVAIGLGQKQGSGKVTNEPGPGTRDAKEASASSQSVGAGLINNTAAKPAPVGG